MLLFFKLEIPFITIILLLNKFQLSFEQSTIKCSNENCDLCPTNKDYCTSAKDGFYTKNGTVIKCSLHCEKCSDKNNCTKCASDYNIYQGMCAFYGEFCQNKFQHCRSYCTEEKCLECESVYKINKSGHCTPEPGFLALFICIALGVIVSSIVCAVCNLYNKRNQHRNLEQHSNHLNVQNVNTVQIISRQNLNGFESTRNLNEKILNDEFEEQKLKKEKTEQVCQFCKKNIGKYICDCGCIVCEEHSKLKEVEKDKQKYKVCFVCGKKVNKVKPRYNCEICMDDVLYVAHFKCNCALEVCCKCYVKCKLESDKCPACRKKI